MENIVCDICGGETDCIGQLTISKEKAHRCKKCGWIQCSPGTQKILERLSKAEQSKIIDRQYQKDFFIGENE